MGFENTLKKGTVGDLPMREAVTVESHTVVRGAVAQMRSKQLGCAVIVDARGHPTAIFTERSLIDALMQDPSLDHCTVGDFARHNFMQVRRSDTIMRVWDAILRHGFRFICVTDDDGKLIGMTGHRGMAEFVSEYFPRQVMVQRLGSKPWLKQREGA